MFPETKSRKTSELEGPYIKCFVVYLDFPLNSHIAKAKKQSLREGSNCAIVFKWGYI